MLRDEFPAPLVKHLARHGHKEEHAHATVPGGDLGIYISPFAEYNIQDKYQPLYRRWDLGDIVAASSEHFGRGNKLKHSSKRAGGVRRCHQKQSGTHQGRLCQPQLGRQCAWPPHALWGVRLFFARSIAFAFKFYR